MRREARGIEGRRVDESARGAACSPIANGVDRRVGDGGNDCDSAAVRRRRRGNDCNRNCNRRCMKCKDGWKINGRCDSRRTTKEEGRRRKCTLNRENRDQRRGRVDHPRMIHI